MSFASPEIEFAWGGGKWRRGWKKVVRPVAETAIGLTEDGRDQFGLYYFMPKQLVAWRAGRNCPEVGLSIGPSRMELLFPHIDIKHCKIGSQIALYTTTLFHEFVHCVRAEFYDSDEPDLIEHTASEGLAYVLEDEFSKALLLDPEQDRIIEKFGSADAESLAYLRQQLVNNSLLIEKHPDWYHKIDNFWLGCDGTYVPPGVALGIWSVQALYNQGLTPMELITTPAEDLLGIAGYTGNYYES